MLPLASIVAPFIPSWSDLRPFLGELALVGTILAVLITPFFVPRRPNGATAFVTLAGLVLALVGIVVAHTGAGAAETGFYFHGMLVSDPLAVAWKGMLIFFVIGLVVMWLGTTGPSMHQGDGPEFFTLLVGATLGLALMASSTNLLMIFLALELASFPSYVLAGFKKHNRHGAEASLKYVLFGAASAAVMAYGLSLLYGIYGTLQLEQFSLVSVEGNGALLAVALGAVGVGVAFKIAAVPFHFWCPDVFEGSSVDVAAFLSVASKGAAIVLLLRIVMTLAHGVGYSPDAPGLSLDLIALVIGMVGAVTATLGNTAALRQTNLKRLLAYSSIAHAGYMVCALSLVVKPASGEFDPHASAQSVVVYLAVYLFMNLGAFAVAGLVWRETGSETVAGLAGLGRRAPVMALCMTVCLVSLIGLPPVAGFFAKLNIMVHLGSQGGWWWALVVVIATNTVLSIYYYLRVAHVMYFVPAPPGAKPLSISPLGGAVAVLSAVKLVVMFLAFGPFDRLASKGSTMLLTDRETAPAVVEK